MTGENGQRSEIFGASKELPLERLAHFCIATLDPGGDSASQLRHFLGEAECAQ